MILPSQWFSRTHYPEKLYFKLPGILPMFLLICSVAVSAAENQRRQVVLEGVLGSKAVLSIDGERKLLSSGQVKNGVKLLSIRPNSAEVEIDGKRRRIRIGESGAISGNYKKRESITVTISPDAKGMYNTVGSINGLPVSFLVDTGATTIAMNSTEARRLGINFRLTGQPTMVSTASGVTKAYGIILDRVTIGSISLNNVRAVVLEGGFPDITLLGMSFLGQLNIQHEGAMMRIKKKY